MSERLRDIVFTGFNKHVIALDQNSGAVLWDWACPKSSGYISLLLTDDTHLIVSVNGYTYCLDPGTGRELWFNELAGYGIGVASLVSSGRASSEHLLMAAAADSDSTSATTVPATNSF
jgi:outer membrane protein assembly factor BamB